VRDVTDGSCRYSIRRKTGKRSQAKRVSERDRQGEGGKETKTEGEREGHRGIEGEAEGETEKGQEVSSQAPLGVPHAMLPEML
jgi:hypothetical protein